MMKIVNLTPHAVRVFDDGALVAEYGDSGVVARVAVTEERLVGIKQKHGAIPIYSVKFGEVQGLPPMVEGVVYIVSLLVKQAAKDRFDLYSPHGLIRGDDGQPIGCKGLC